MMWEQTVATLAAVPRKRLDDYNGDFWTPAYWYNVDCIECGEWYTRRSFRTRREADAYVRRCRADWESRREFDRVRIVEVIVH